MLVLALAGCGVSNAGADHTLPVSVTISPANTTAQAGDTKQFTATVVNGSSSTVVWHVNGIAGGNATSGTITADGLYTAPATVPNPATVTITAFPAADPTQFNVATVTIVPRISVSVTPTTATVAPGAQQPFAATVANSSNQSVTWSVSGTGCTGAACGAITTAGVYTAPATAPNPNTVTVTATSAADTRRTATATITIAVPITVTVAPLTADVQVSQTHTFGATVTGTTDTAVTWSVAGAGCTGAACGAIDANGLYTAPATVPTPETVTVTATSHADATKTGTATVTIKPVPPGVTVTVAPKTATVGLGNTQRFNATISDDGGVTWKVNGVAGGDSTYGTITGSGLYAAPATMPNLTVKRGAVKTAAAATTVDITITATSNTDPNISDTATVTLTDQTSDPNLAKLQGTYVYLFSGYQGTSEIARVGTFIADGNGAVTGGLQDVVGVGAATSVPVTGGSYTVGADNRGELTVATATKSVTYRFVLAEDGSGQMIEFDATDANGTHGTGHFKKQQAGYLNGTDISGDWAFQLVGSKDGQNRLGMVGRFTTDGYLNTGVDSAAGEIDYVTAGTLAKHAGLSVQFQYISDVDNAYAITAAPDDTNVSMMWKAYLVSKDEGFVVNEDFLSNGATPVVGRLVRQVGAGSYDASSLNGAVIFQLNGYDLDPGDRSKTAMGRIVMGGDGTFSGIIDQNDINDPQPYVTYPMDGTYTVDAKGRVQGNFSIAGGAITVPLTFYLYGPNQGFVMDGMRGVDIVKDVNIGTFEPQSGGPFIAITDTFTVGWNEMVTKDVRLPIGLVSFGAGPYTATLDADLLPPIAGFTIDAGMFTAPEFTTGRASMAVEMPDRLHHLILYMVSPSKMYGMSIDPEDGNSVIITFKK